MVQTIRGDHGMDRVPSGMAKLMAEWERLSTHREWRDSGDCPWWYGERASVSQLAGAAWKLDGWAMEEYAWTRGSEGSYARVDLCVELESSDLYVIAEAKQVWPDLESRPGTIKRQLDLALQDAEAQASALPPDDRYTRYALVFVAPRAAADPVTDPAFADRLAACVDVLRSIDGAAVAWTFPDWARSLVSEVTGKHYPGVALVVRPVPRT